MRGRGCAVRCGRALVGACSALLGMGRGEITCARKLSPNVIAYVDRSGRRNSGRYMAPAQPGLRFAASYRGRECVVRAPGPRGTAPAGPPRAEREDDEDRDPRSDDEIFVVPRKIRYALRARRRNRWCVARSVPFVIVYILFFRCVGRSLRWLIVRVRSDPCTCTVERSTPTTT